MHEMQIWQKIVLIAPIRQNSFNRPHSQNIF